MNDRIRNNRLKEKVCGAEEAAALFQDGDTLAVSGFTPSGCPKAIPLAIAERIRKSGETLRLTLLTGASTGPELDETLGPLGIIARRYPYITSAGMRKAVNGKIQGVDAAYADRHLGFMARDTRNGVFGKVDYAVIEAVSITEEGYIIPTTALGCSQAFIDCAEKVIVEVNVTMPEALEGFHDIVQRSGEEAKKPLMLERVDQRIGKPYLVCPEERIAAVVLSRQPEHPRSFADPDENSQAIAANIIRLLQQDIEAGRLDPNGIVMQSGVGGVANAVLKGLLASDLKHLSFYSEVMHDGIIDLIDAGKADFCSATSMSLSPEGMKRLLANLERYRDKLVLRDSEVSNSGDAINRLGVIAVNTAIEADIYGNVNSSHMNGTSMYNGIGGSGDYARSARLTIFVTNSTAKNGDISCIVPMVTHVDHTEHDVDVIVTEQGCADLRGLAPKERASLIIENCAHPVYRPQLRKYYEDALAACGGVQTPHLLGRCFDFHLRLQQTGSMLEQGGQPE